ncbi:MAG: TolC family protein [Gemmataceae bacterium]
MRPTLLLLMLGTGCGVVGLGCSRLHFRERADADVAGVITQKNLFPDWKVENWHVYPDPVARFADPSCPDHPPYPPDDYAAWLTSPNPQKPEKGIGSGRFEGTGYLDRIRDWDAINRAEDSPVSTSPNDAAKALDRAYPETLRSVETPFRLKLEQAVELGVINSREFQDRREDLYLSALPVTQERFSFAAQALGTENIVREVAGRDRLEGGGQRWNLGTDLRVTRLFPTGATLLARFANQVVLDLSNGRPDLSVSTFTLTFLQPLLRGGGYAVTLEALTQAERTLLYALRSYARFRKVFYVAIVSQGDYTNNPYGLQGLSANLGRGIGNNLTAPRAGYLPTVLRNATLANERKNIVALESTLKLFQNLKEGGGVNELQVVRVEQQLLRSRGLMLTNTRLYADLIDNFKLQLGVPTTLPLELDDEALRPMRQQLQRYEDVFTQLREFGLSVAEFRETETPAELRERWKKLLTESPLVKDVPLAKEYPTEAAALAKLTTAELNQQLAELGAQRQKFLDVRAERQLKELDESVKQLAELERLDARIDLLQFEKALQAYDARPWTRSLPPKQRLEQQSAYRLVVDSGLLVAIRARNQRLDKLRAAWPDLPEINVDGQNLIQTPLDEATGAVGRAALNNRLDLMNARAQVVDQYRQIAVRANALLSQLDVGYNLGTNTPRGDNEPFSFGGSRTLHQATLRFDPPFVRRAERNLYRAALIGYQRQRRTLMAFEDNILTDTRSDLRNVRTLAATYNLQKRGVELAYTQVDNARSTLLAPPDPTARETAGNVAALTQQLLEAQSGLLQAQNDLYATWINYLTARMELALDLEILPLDARGVWTDERFRNTTPPVEAPPAP